MLQQKVSLKKKASIFVHDDVSICSRSLSRSDRMLLLLIKQGFASPATELIVSRRNETGYLETTKNLSSGKRSLMFWGAIRSD